MASLLPSAKSTVDLTGAGPRVSKIRRDPPPPPSGKTDKIELKDYENRDTLTVVLGVTGVMLVLVVTLLVVASLTGWTPRDTHLFL